MKKRKKRLYLVEMAIVLFIISLLILMWYLMCKQRGRAISINDRACKLN